MAAATRTRLLWLSLAATFAAAAAVAEAERILPPVTITSRPIYVLDRRSAPKRESEALDTFKVALEDSVADPAMRERILRFLNSLPKSNDSHVKSHKLLKMLDVKVEKHMAKKGSNRGFFGDLWNGIVSAAGSIIGIAPKPDKSNCTAWCEAEARDQRCNDLEAYRYRQLRMGHNGLFKWWPRPPRCPVLPFVGCASPPRCSGRCYLQAVEPAPSPSPPKQPAASTTTSTKKPATTTSTSIKPRDSSSVKPDDLSPPKPGEKPGNGKPGEKPGNGKPGNGKPGEKPGNGKPGGKPGEKPGNGKPEDKPGNGKPGEKPDEKPGEGIPDNGKPGEKPGNGKPGEKPDDKPGNGKPGGKPGNGKPGGKPDEKPGNGKPDEKPGNGKPGEKPGNGKPGEKPDEKPGNGKPGGKPDDKPGNGKPDEKPGNGKPGEKPGNGKPGEKPGNGKPGGKPGNGKPGEKPDEKPGNGKPEDQPGEKPDGGKPGEKADGDDDDDRSPSTLKPKFDVSKSKRPNKEKGRGLPKIKSPKFPGSKKPGGEDEESAPSDKGEPDRKRVCFDANMNKMPCPARTPGGVAKGAGGRRCFQKKGGKMVELECPMKSPQVVQQAPPVPSKYNYKFTSNSSSTYIGIKYFDDAVNSRVNGSVSKTFDDMLKALPAAKMSREQVKEMNDLLSYFNDKPPAPSKKRGRDRALTLPDLGAGIKALLGHLFTGKSAHDCKCDPDAACKRELLARQSLRFGFFKRRCQGSCPNNRGCPIYQCRLAGLRDAKAPPANLAAAAQTKQQLLIPEEIDDGFDLSED